MTQPDLTRAPAREAVAVPSAPPTPTVDAHAARLREPWSLHRKLLPVPTLLQIVRELDVALAARTPEHYAQRLALSLVGSYPHQQPPMPEIYLAGVAEELAGYPPDVAHQTVRNIRRSLRFLPTIAEIVEEANRLYSERAGLRRAAYYQLQEHRHDAERERRRAELWREQPEAVAPSGAASVADDPST